MAIHFSLLAKIDSAENINDEIIRENWGMNNDEGMH